MSRKNKGKNRNKNKPLSRRQRAKLAAKQQAQEAQQAKPPPERVPVEVVDDYVPWHEKFGLNDKQRQAVENYLDNGGNKTQAVIDAGYSPKNARQSANQVFNSQKVKDALRTLSANEIMTQEELVASISNDAKASMENFIRVHETRKLVLDENTGKMEYITFSDVDIDWAKAKRMGALSQIASLKISHSMYGKRVEFKLVDAQKAKDQLIKIYGLGSETINLNDGDNTEQNNKQLPEVDFDNMTPDDIARHWQDLSELQRGGDD